MKNRMRLFAGAALLGAVVTAYAAPAWQEGATYTAGTVVSYNGQDYTALVTHTAYAGTGWNPAASPTLWKSSGSSTPTTVVTPTATLTPTAVITPTPTPISKPTPYQCPVVSAIPGAVITGYDQNGCAIYSIPTPTVQPTPTSAPTASNWDKAATYTGGQRVSYNGQLYEAKWWTQGDVPGASEWGPWKLLGALPTPTPTVTPTPPTPTPTGPVLPPPIPSWTTISAPADGGLVFSWQLGSGPYINKQNSALAWLAIVDGRDVHSGTASWTFKGSCASNGLCGDSYVPSGGYRYIQTTGGSTYKAAICIDPKPIPAVMPVPPRDASNCGVFFEQTVTVPPQMGISPTPTATPLPSPTPTSAPSYTPGTIPSKAQADALEVELTKDAPAYVKLVKETQRVIDDSIVDQVAPLAATNPDNVKRVERIVPAARFDYLFAIRNAKYSYSNFLKAVAKFPAFCQTYSDGRNSDAICSKLLATMFAHMVQETGANTTWLDGIGAIDTPKWRQGLYWVEEVAYQNNPNLSGYTDSCGDPYWGKIWTCPKRADGQYNSYHGRGAHQLTHHYNYAPFSKVLYGDPNVLLQDPKRVADTWLNLASSVFFMLETQPPKPAMIHVIDGSWVPNAVDQANGLTASFGTTINIINGGFECSKGAETSQAQNRIYAYQNFAQELGVPVAANEQLGCASQKQFSEGGAASFPLYWDKDWGWQRDYMCKPVNYQTGFRTISKGDYAKCVEFIWNVQVK
ncbi:glycoside hydrolase family 19 protein [Chitinilyticum piscinae]|uniref:Chitinase n=1 Tax=Chitinilyticum piscinae TaxID=2866724 RepID=A0A8J7FQU7_9NEIS|nr:glycoside hydrolase family 19 protein [Chitinilyticum piscinae]MBE9610619.1 chitinase [Chitinilyticum piscinae]